MTMYGFEGKVPQVGPGTFVHPSADVIGDVVIGPDCYIGPGARIRGDYGAIRIGPRSGVEENCVLHARPDEMCVVGADVTVGHGAILHNCTVEDGAVVGMGAVVSDWAVVGSWAAVGEGAVVKQSQRIGPEEIAVGVPARIVGTVTPAWKTEWARFKALYVDLAHRYPAGLTPL